MGSVHKRDFKVYIFRTIHCQYIFLFLLYYVVKLDFDDIYKHILDVDRIAEEKKGKVDFQH